MIRKTSRSTAFWLGALLLASAAPISAQVAERPADRLSRYLRDLAADPTSITALIGAGQAALDVGDGNAALGFFARADERSPRNGQIKAGLARALLMVDNPREALKMFDAARSLGVPDLQIAADRGLAYDLKGDNRRAQQDYVLALARAPNDEVTKRYALSLGITGDRDRALQLLDPLLYKRDQGAWRARAFVLAMTGDIPGASKIVHQVMPQRMATTMDPFLMRLGSLNAAQKAAAVHLGEMPADARFATNTMPNPAPAPPPQAYQASAAQSLTPAPTPSPTPDPREARRRPAHEVPLASPPPPRVRARPAPTPTPVPTPTPTPTPTPQPSSPVQLAQKYVAPSYAPTGQAVPTSRPSAPVALPPQQRGDLDAIIKDIRTAAATSTPIRTAQAAPRPRPTPTPTATPTPKAKPEVVKPEPKKTKAEIAKEAAAKADPKAAKAADAKAGAKTGKAALADKKKKPEPPKAPARIWVQVAGGANVSALPKEWTAVSGKAAELKGKGPWTAKNRATNRLLAGPYKTEAEAQAAVVKLRKAGIGAFRWASEEGETVEKIGGK